MMKMDRKKASILLSVVAVAAILGSMGLVYGRYYSTDSTNGNNGEMMLNTYGWPMQEIFDDNYNFTGMPPRCPRGGRGYGFIEVSEEYKENVINIAKNDSDVQELLADGYNITGVRPIIKTVVEANGDVVTKATTAIVMLSKNTTGRASVWVDIVNAKVTRIEILTRTVIEKS